MISDEASPIIVDIAKRLMLLVRDAYPDWQEAYLRFSINNLVSDVKASCVHGRGVDVMDVIQHGGFFQLMGHQGKELMRALGLVDGVFLLVVNSKYDYEIHFERADMTRWRISKLDGGTGVPAGMGVPGQA